MLQRITNLDTSLGIHVEHFIEEIDSFGRLRREKLLKVNLGFLWQRLYIL